MSEKMGYQVLESIEADFDQMTWTFRLQPSNRVSAGNFALVPVEQFMQMNAKLQQAEHLLRDLREIGPISPKHKDMVERYFDPAF